MNWRNQYIPPSHALWQGRSDTPPESCFFQQIRLLNLQEDIPQSEELTFAILGFRCDEGIRRNLGRIGAAEGPLAIREVLAKLPLHRPNTICYDAGDIICIDNDLEAAQEVLGEAVFLLLKNNIIPVVLGGGHEVAFGHYQGMIKKFPQENLGIINFDAHFDMRPVLEEKGSSGTPFLQIAEASKINNHDFSYYCFGIQKSGNIPALLTTAKEHQVKTVYAETFQEKDTCLKALQDAMLSHQMIYLSICLDVFAAAFAPGVSAPQALGLSPWQVIPLIRTIAASGKVISYDLAELCPKYDIDAHTAKLAANIIYEIIHHHQ